MGPYFLADQGDSMKAMRVVAFVILGSIGFLPAAALAQTPPLKSYSIDQSRYFPTPEAESTQLKQRLKEAAAFPSKAPADPSALAEYLRRGEDLLGQLQRHQAYLHLRASRDMDDQADADADDKASDAMDSVVDSVGAALRTLGGAAFAKAAAANAALNR